MLRTLLFLLVAIGLVSCGETPSPENPASAPVEAPKPAPQPAPEVEQAISIYDRAEETTPIILWLERELEGSDGVAFTDPLDAAGFLFVQLALRMGRLDGDYVDAYHGPAILRARAEESEVVPEQLAADIRQARTDLAQYASSPSADPVRAELLDKLLRGMQTRLKVIQGETVSFNTEVTEIYDEQIPTYDLAEYDAVLAEIDAMLPGEGTTADRVDAFRNTLAIPKDKLRPVFDRAITECRTRTQAHFDLPDGEKFRMEFVTDKSWSGYNYYQGGFESLIQINTDFPIIIDRAVDLGCHEGYPGHHVWNLFIERELVGTRGWIEYSVNPLFGPFGPVAEGSANYGIQLAFPGSEKIEFERDVLFPMAGLDPAQAQKLQDLNALTGKLSHATNEIARQYLDGALTAEEAVPLIQKYYLASTEKSAQRLRFIDKYRGYVINYNIGRDRAASWVEAAGNDPANRWAAFEEMLTRPMTPGDIAEVVK